MKKNTIYFPVIIAIALVLGIYLGKYLMVLQNPDSKAYTFSLNNGDSKFDEILNYIDENYVDTIDRQKMENEAIVGMLDKLDPHSQYVTKEEFNEMNDPLLGSFEGIGVSFRIEKDTIMVINVIKGGPSEKVGLMDGDRIVYIGDSLVVGKKVNNNTAMRLLKGPKGTEVDVKILRKGISDLLDFKIVRDVIPTYSLDVAYMIDDEIGFIKLNKFAATTYDEFKKAVKELEDQGMKKIILDLRGNTGGYMGAAIDIADEFLSSGKLIVYTEGKNRPRSYAFATSKGRMEENELIILIDEGSASASEIVAGAIQDNDRGTIVGRRSFGKGLVQDQIVLEDNSSVRLTVARYFTLTGRSIQKPYDGDKEKYLYETIDRYLTGEIFHEDSIHFADSLKYTTPGGKVVYGGGGIMPDVYVSLGDDTLQYYYNRLVNSGLLFQYAFDYADTHRAELKKFESPEAFNKSFTFTDAMFNEFIRQGEEKGIKGTDIQKKVMRKETGILFKSYVARQIFDDKGFYPIYQEIDDILLRAIEEFKK